VKVKAVSPGATVELGVGDAGCDADADSVEAVGVAEADVAADVSGEEVDVVGVVAVLELVQALRAHALATRTMTKRFTVFLTSGSSSADPFRVSYPE